MLKIEKIKKMNKKLRRMSNKLLNKLGIRLITVHMMV